MKASDPRSEIDYQFNPTLWTPRIGSEEFIPAHVEYARRKAGAIATR